MGMEMIDLYDTPEEKMGMEIDLIMADKSLEKIPEAIKKAQRAELLRIADQLLDAADKDPELAEAIMAGWKSLGRGYRYVCQQTYEFAKTSVGFSHPEGFHTSDEYVLSLFKSYYALDDKADVEKEEKERAEHEAKAKELREKAAAAEAKRKKKAEKAKKKKEEFADVDITTVKPTVNSEPNPAASEPKSSVSDPEPVSSETGQSEDMEEFEQEDLFSMFGEM